MRGHEQPGSRPVLVLSHDVFNARSGTVMSLERIGRRLARASDAEVARVIEGFNGIVNG